MYTRVNHNIDIAFLFFFHDLSLEYKTRRENVSKALSSPVLQNDFRSRSFDIHVSSTLLLLFLSLSLLVQLLLDATLGPHATFSILSTSGKSVSLLVGAKTEQEIRLHSLRRYYCPLIYTSCIRCLELSFSSSGSRIDGQKNDAEKTLLERRCKCFNISLMNEGQQVGEMLLLKALFQEFLKRQAFYLRRIDVRTLMEIRGRKGFLLEFFIFS